MAMSKCEVLEVLRQFLDGESDRDDALQLEVVQFRALIVDASEQLRGDHSFIFFPVLILLVTLNSQLEEIFVCK